MTKPFYLLYIFITTPFFTMIFAQGETYSTTCYEDNFSDTDKVFTRVENKPYFRGGDDALLTFLLTNFDLRQISKKLQPNERTFTDTARVVFLITKESKIGNIKVSLFKDGTFGEAIAKLIKNSSCNWKPGDFGRYVTSWYQLDIYFTLERRRDETTLRFKLKHYDFKTD